jgi:hypothetical protein
VSLALPDKRDIPVEEYNKSLKQAFSEPQYQGFQPSLNQLKQQLQKRNLFAVIIRCTLLPVLLADTNSAPDMSKLISKKDIVYLSEAYKKALKKLLPFSRRKVGCSALHMWHEISIRMLAIMHYTLCHETSKGWL